LLGLRVVDGDTGEGFEFDVSGVAVEVLETISIVSIIVKHTCMGGMSAAAGKATMLLRRLVGSNDVGTKCRSIAAIAAIMDRWADGSIATTDVAIAASKTRAS